MNKNGSSFEISEDLWEVVSEHEKVEEIQGTPMTYWEDVFRRFKQNKLSVIGIFIIVGLILIGIFGPYLSSHNYSDQNIDYGSVPPRLAIRKLNDDTFFYINPNFKVYEVSEDGVLLNLVTDSTEDLINKNRTINIDENKVIIDYSEKPYKVLDSNGEEINIYKKVGNKTYKFGTDDLGRDLLTRVIYGARISLIIGLVSAVVNLVVGVMYGGIAGYLGGTIDIVMMRIIEILDSVPRLLYVIIFMLIFGSGLGTVAITIGLTSWLGMAKMVRGQVLSLKESEYILAAQTVGSSTWRIITKHLIPNTMSIVIVQAAMGIPSAIFTESYLSFVGLGVSAPQASWGTLSDNALPGLTTYPYKLFFPAMAIGITVLAFNIVGDGLRDALDPSLRN